MIEAEGTTRAPARRATKILDGLTPKEFAQAQSLAELSLYSQGVTFSVYSDQRGTEKIFPICLVPRVISGAEWPRVEKRLVTKRSFQSAIEESAVRPVEQYPMHLAETLRAISPVDPAETRMVLLTPGSFNSAYFEHTFLARTMGVELVEPGDLFVDDDTVFVRTIRGPERVHVIYRRIDDAYLDPEFFRPDSLLGVPGVMRAYAAGNVALANAPGNGVADDKAVYPFVPDMIHYYLGEEAILAQVDTYVCTRPDDLKYVLENLSQLVVKAVDEAGGYGMLMGPQASAAEIEEFRARIIAEPRRYIAQHRVELSTCPTWVPGAEKLAPRRVDLRPIILTQPSGSWVLPGGLTREALVEGSYVVNSRQGGGSQDTWVQKDKSL